MLSKSWNGRNGMTTAGKKATVGEGGSSETKVEELGNETSHTQMVGELSSLSQKIVFGSMGLSHICDVLS